jgi:muramoyltetrapeptide carboxypeptidase
MSKDTLNMTKIALIRTGSACWQQDDPDFTRQWLLKEHHLHADFHPEIQAWLTPKQRAEIFMQYLLDNQYDVLWSLRGGEGSADVLPYLHEHAATIAQAKPKMLIGFSDFTAVLNYFNQVYHWPVVHGPGVVRLARGTVHEDSVNNIFNLIQNRNAPLQLSHLNPLNEMAKKTEIITGELCGGNLSVLAISVKDIWEIQTTDKILILEDINEKAHKISALLHYLQRINLMNHPRAIIFGDFIYENDDKQQAAISRTLQRFAESCEFPVLHTLEFGHGKDNFPLPFFREVEVRAEKEQPINLRRFCLKSPY